MKNLKQKVLALIVAISTITTMMPVMHVMASSADYLIAKAEFNGSDDTSKWARFYANNKFVEYALKGEVSNGNLITTPSNTSFGRWGVYFGEGDDAYAIDSTKKNIYVETKTKFTATDTTKTASDLDSYFYALAGHCTANNTYKAFSTVGVKGGVLSYGVEASDTKTDYTISLDTWYTISARVDFAEKKTYLSITDNNGNDATFSWGFLWGATFDNISQVTGTKNEQVGFAHYMDYIRVYDADLMPAPTVTCNGETLDGAVIKDTTVLAEITFSSEITQVQADLITVNDASVEKYVDGNTVYYYMSDLVSRKAYTINIPAINSNTAKTVTFTIADEGYYITRNEFDGLDDTSKWARFLSGDNFAEYALKGDVSNGYLVTTPSNTGFGRWGVYYGTDEPVSISNTKKNIYFETKFKATSTDQTKTASDLTAYFYAITGRCTSNNVYRIFSTMGTENGKLFYGVQGTKTDTDYDIALDIWYTIKVQLDFVNKKSIAVVTDEIGNEETFNWNFLWGASFDTISQVTGIQNALAGYTHYTDYVRLYDEDLMPKEPSPYDFYAEFDGNDDTSKWSNFDQKGAKRDNASNGVIENDIIKLTTSNTSFGRWGVYYGTGDDAYKVSTDANNVVVSTRVKVEKTSDSVTALPDAEWLSVWGRRTSQASTDNLSLLDLGAKGGKLAYGYPFASATQLNYDVEFDTWYTITESFDYDARKAIVTIKADGSEEQEFEVAFTWGLQFENITQITLSKNLTNNIVYSYDYLRLERTKTVSEFDISSAKFTSNATNVDVEFNYDSPDNRNITFIVANYDSTGRFVGITTSTITAQKGFGKTLTVTSPSADVLKALVWDGLESLNPVSKVFNN